MKVSELITFLQTKPQDLQVSYLCSEHHILLEARSIYIFESSLPREGGWIDHEEPGMATQKYLCFLGG